MRNNDTKWLYDNLVGCLLKGVSWSSDNRPNFAALAVKLSVKWNRDVFVCRWIRGKYDKNHWMSSTFILDKSCRCQLLLWFFSSVAHEHVNEPLSRQSKTSVYYILFLSFSRPWCLREVLSFSSSFWPSLVKKRLAITSRESTSCALADHNRHDTVTFITCNSHHFVTRLQCTVAGQSPAGCCEPTRWFGRDLLDSTRSRRQDELVPYKVHSRAGPCWFTCRLAEQTLETPTVLKGWSGRRTYQGLVIFGAGTWKFDFLHLNLSFRRAL